MKKIELTKGYSTIVDDADFEYLNQWSWYFDNGYVARNKYCRKTQKCKIILMHREILKTPQDKDSDHKNGDKLDNRKVNLRICTRSQNKMNSGKYSNNTSTFKGVSFNKQRKRWRVQIQINRNLKYLGYFKDIEEAALAYNAAAIKYHGEFAYLNKI